MVRFFLKRKIYIHNAYLGKVQTNKDITCPSLQNLDLSGNPLKNRQVHFSTADLFLTQDRRIDLILQLPAQLAGIEYIWCQLWTGFRAGCVSAPLLSDS